MHTLATCLRTSPPTLPRGSENLTLIDFISRRSENPEKPRTFSPCRLSRTNDIQRRKRTLE